MGFMGSRAFLFTVSTGIAWFFTAGSSGLGLASTGIDLLAVFLSPTQTHSLLSLPC
jgi:hypothetical protein